jgi:hypothetical protein
MSKSTVFLRFFLAYILVMTSVSGKEIFRFNDSNNEQPKQSLAPNRLQIALDELTSNEERESALLVDTGMVCKGKLGLQFDVIGGAFIGLLESIKVNVCKNDSIHKVFQATNNKDGSVNIVNFCQNLTDRTELKWCGATPLTPKDFQSIAAQFEKKRPSKEQRLEQLKKEFGESLLQYQNIMWSQDLIDKDIVLSHNLAQSKNSFKRHCKPDRILNLFKPKLLCEGQKQKEEEVELLRQAKKEFIKECQKVDSSKKKLKCPGIGQNILDFLQNEGNDSQASIVAPPIAPVPAISSLGTSVYQTNERSDVPVNQTTASPELELGDNMVYSFRRSGQSHNLHSHRATQALENKMFKEVESQLTIQISKEDSVKINSINFGGSREEIERKLRVQVTSLVKNARTEAEKTVKGENGKVVIEASPLDASIERYIQYMTDKHYAAAVLKKYSNTNPDQLTKPQTDEIYDAISNENRSQLLTLFKGDELKSKEELSKFILKEYKQHVASVKAITGNNDLESNYAGAFGELLYKRAEENDNSCFQLKKRRESLCQGSLVSKNLGEESIINFAQILQTGEPEANRKLLLASCAQVAINSNEPILCESTLSKILSGWEEPEIKSQYANIEMLDGSCEKKDAQNTIDPTNPAGSLSNLTNLTPKQQKQQATEELRKRLSNKPTLAFANNANNSQQRNDGKRKGKREDFNDFFKNKFKEKFRGNAKRKSLASNSSISSGTFTPKESYNKKRNKSSASSLVEQETFAKKNSKGTQEDYSSYDPQSSFNMPNYPRTNYTPQQENLLNESIAGANQPKELIDAARTLPSASEERKQIEDLLKELQSTKNKVSELETKFKTQSDVEKSEKDKLQEQKEILEQKKEIELLKGQIAGLAKERKKSLEDEALAKRTKALNEQRISEQNKSLQNPGQATTKQKASTPQQGQAGGGPSFKSRTVAGQAPAEFLGGASRPIGSSATSTNAQINQATTDNKTLNFALIQNKVNANKVTKFQGTFNEAEKLGRVVKTLKDNGEYVWVILDGEGNVVVDDYGQALYKELDAQDLQVAQSEDIKVTPPPLETTGQHFRVQGLDNVLLANP